ncbi:hypothetical protein SLEP1_g25659 [Rubroshorea leprosula]|uniref:Uncharacterized protein n=1 Tax=Rubroshorea leprosula TaxID=152421 RepID=A0AAV5JVW1_9ROSI|nr:hypothetical protein SLEP1_g25659 [Rubroshorea leprosula]
MLDESIEFLKSLQQQVQFDKERMRNCQGHTSLCWCLISTSSWMMILDVFKYGVR